MKKQKMQAVLQRADPKDMSPEGLFDACIRQEGLIAKTPYRKRVQEILKGLLFLHPLFERTPLGGYRPFEEDSRRKYPFDFCIAPPAQLTISEYEWRYHKLLDHLSKLTDNDLRWLLIARWLKQEGVCEPEQFLCAPVLERLIKKFKKRFTLSPSDLHLWVLINTWRTYFEKLHTDYATLKSHRRVRQELERLGYEGTAIEKFLMHRRSTIQAVCAWLTEHKHLGAGNLRNAYSRLQPTGKKLRSS